MKKIRLSVCLHLGSKEHFPWKHENIDFYTILRSVGVDTHPLTSYGYFRGHRYTSGVKKTFFMKTWKYRVLHESEVGCDEYSSCGVTGDFRGHRYTSGVKKTFFMKTWKYRVLHESEVGWDEYSSCGTKGTLSRPKAFFKYKAEIPLLSHFQSWVMICLIYCNFRSHTW